MRNISDSTIRNLLFAALIIMIIVLGFFSLSAFAADGSILIGGRIATVIYQPSPAGNCPLWTACTPYCTCAPGDLMQRQIAGAYFTNILADVAVYSPASAKRYTSILIPKSSRGCLGPRAGSFFIGKGIPVGPGQTALLMTIIGCSK
jgi:hypothetical protein